MSKKTDMCGRNYGHLYVVEEAEKHGSCRSHDTLWRCLCRCGKESVVRGSYLRNGHTKTCGGCNRYSREGSYIRCTVSSGRSFIFDECDLPIVQQYSWSLCKDGYVLSSSGKLHRILMNSPTGSVVDHINGDPSDCRRENLRVTSQRKNTYNARLSSNSTSGYKGVCFDKRRGRYMASIHPGGCTKFLGYYDAPQEAAAAYDKAAAFFYGEFARLNGV